MRRGPCVTPVAVLCAFGLGLVLSFLCPPKALVCLLAIALLILCCIRIRR